MKSIIMALFLMSVSLGNLFTAGVNHFIIVPDSLTEVKQLVSSWHTDDGTKVVTDKTHQTRMSEASAIGVTYQAVTDGGFEIILGGSDEIRVGYNADLHRTSLEASEVDVIKSAIASVGSFWDEYDRLPLTDEGSEIVSRFEDQRSNVLHYRLVNRRNFVITSDGPDSEFMTEDDVRALVGVTSDTVGQQQEMAANAGGSDLLANLHPTHSWMVIRQAEIDAAKARADENPDAQWDQFIQEEVFVDPDTISKQEHAFDISWEIGGATTLEGAPYFEFFTWLMLCTAILFVGVGYLYKPKTYIQDEGMIAAAATLE